MNSECLKSRVLLETIGTEGKAETRRLYEATQGCGVEGGQQRARTEPEDSRKELRCAAAMEPFRHNACLRGVCTRM